MFTTGYEEGVIVLFDVSSNPIRHRVHDVEGLDIVDSALFSGDGKKIVLGSFDSWEELQVYDPTTEKVVRRLIHEADVEAMTCFDDRVVSCVSSESVESDEMEIYVWNVNTGEKIVCP